MSIPDNYKHEIKARAKDLARAEVAGDVPYIYALIYPGIRERREKERDDEPDLTLRSIDKFSKTVKVAELNQIEFIEYYPVSKIYGSDPAIKVKYSFLYNNESTSIFTSIWVRVSGSWYTTSMGKFRVKNA